MKKKYIDKFKAELPLLAFGCMRLPKHDDKIDFDEAHKMVQRAMECGVNYFDTAYNYHNGESEIFLGKVLPEFSRESYYLTTKLPIWKVEKEGDAEQIFDEQLKKCNTEYFDFYHLHSMDNSRVEIMEKFKLYDFIAGKKAEGKIKNIGFSFHDKPEVLKKIVSLHDWDFVQLQINYWDWTEDEAEAKYKILEEAGIPCFIMEPVRGGFLASFAEKAAKPLKDYAPDKSLASWAIRWAASLPNVASVLSGMSTMEQLNDNIATLSSFEPISAEEQAVIDVTIEELKKIKPVPCTGCRYCMECPFGVDIPGIFGIYNDYKKTENKALASRSYSFVEDKAKAESCQKCGACVKQCPQHIDIPGELEKIGMEFA